MKSSIGENRMKAECCRIIKRSMGCEERQPSRAEIVQFLRKNLQNEALWLIMAGALEGRQRFDCLERALRINPKNERTFGLMKTVNLKRAYRVARRMGLFEPHGHYRSAEKAERNP